MSHAMTTTIDGTVTEGVARVKAALAEQGFGVLTEIDMAATLKAKLGVDVPEHVILGACNPPLAFQALQADPSVGLMLPCNVVVRTDAEGRTLIEAIDPVALAPAMGSAGLSAVADQARTHLAAAINAL